MVEKLNFLSGIYDIELIVGDDIMVRSLSYISANIHAI